MSNRLINAAVAAMLPLAPTFGQDGLTIGDVVTNIPHDAAAFVVYAMLFGAVALVWRTGRPSS